MDGNRFGKLIRSYRKQRDWSQQELAERWGFTREYVSQIERGRRKLDKQEQVIRLANVLGIPPERLDAVGKSIPQNTIQKLEGDDILIQALLEPAETTIKMSWLLWHEDNRVIDVGESLHHLESRLNQVLQVYRGQFYRPALRILAFVYEMRGKLAIERAATQEAISHFQEMYSVAEELGDVNLTTLAQIHLSEMLRRRGWYEAAFRRIEIAEKYIQNHNKEVSEHIQGMMWKAYSINYFASGNEDGFLRTINKALAIAEDTGITVDTLSSDFDKVEVLQVKAQGHTQLWKPAKALEIYKETDALRSFRPMRDQSSYHIVKAQAYCYVGDMKRGPEYALAGLKMAEELHSVRYIIRLLQMSDRLLVTSIGQQRVMKELREEILAALQRVKKQSNYTGRVAKAAKLRA